MKHNVVGILFLIQILLITAAIRVESPSIHTQMEIPQNKGSNSICLHLKWTFDGYFVSRSLALADIDGDGDLEIISGEVFSGVDLNVPRLLIINGEDGKLIWSYNLSLGIDLYSSPSIADINGDGILEVVVIDGIGQVLCLNSKNGSLVWSSNITMIGGTSPPTLGDTSGDGYLEVVFGGGQRNSTYCLNGEDGSLLWKFDTNGTVLSSPALGDLDSNGHLEIVFGSGDGYIYCLNGEDGSLLWKFDTNGTVLSSPALGDLDGDLCLEVVVGNYNGSVYCLNGEDGSLLWKFLGGPQDNPSSSASLGDVDGDNRLEVVVSQGSYLFLLDGNGSLICSFKDKREVSQVPYLGDVDGDGILEIVVIRYSTEYGGIRFLVSAVYCFDITNGGFRVYWNGFCGEVSPNGCYRSKNMVYLDPDGDMLSSYSERILGTSIADPDSDGDGLPDGLEVYYGLDPLNPDTDSNGYEFVRKHWRVLAIIIATAVVFVVFLLERGTSGRSQN